jgi:hypothetical protein
MERLNSHTQEKTMPLRSLLCTRLCLATALVLSLALSAAAAPTDPVTVEPPPTGQGDIFSPGVRLVEDLAQDYVEEEYFVSGAADLFSYANNPPLGPTDLTTVQTDVPYKTRIIVRRPANHGQFNGTVVIEWWNSTADFDTAPVWDPSAEYFARNGVVYVGVTNANQSLSFLTGGCSLLGLLPPTCGTRYATLSLPDDGLIYDAVSQIANLLKSDSPENPLPDDFDVERIYHAGQSQQGGSMVTYASAFHFPVNDGYFVQQASGARSINAGPSCENPASPPYPNCTPRLQGLDRLVRTDLPVPVVHAVTELDIEILFGTFGRQADTPTFRYYEIAGGGHVTVHKGVELIPAGILGPNPIFLDDLCLNEMNTTADGPVFASYVFNALWENLEDQVQRGIDPPPGVVMDVVNGVVQRDAYNNGLGGVRLPALEVPVASYSSGNVGDPGLSPLLTAIGNLACFLSGSVAPLDAATLDTLYPNHGSYVIITAAALSPIGCGLGFELTLVLPPLMWWRQRRRGCARR